MSTAPAVTGFSTSPAGTLQPGTPFTVTVTYVPGTSAGTPVAQPVTATVTDSNSNLVGTLQGSLSFGQTITDPCTVTFTDGTSRVYTPGSNTVTGGTGTALFSAVA